MQDTVCNSAPVLDKIVYPVTCAWSAAPTCAGVIRYAAVPGSHGLCPACREIVMAGWRRRA